MSVPFSKARKGARPNNSNNSNNNNNRSGGRQQNNNHNNNNGGGRGGGGGGRGGKGPGGRGGGNQQHRGPGHHKPGGGQDNSSVLRTMLKLVFEKQQSNLYADNVLQLSNFRECPDLASVKRAIDFNTVAFCESLCGVVKETIPDVQFICIDNNNINGLNFFLDALSKNNLNDVVRGISVAGNRIDNYDFLGKLGRFRNLVEVSFSGNPIAGRDDYRSKLAKKLPQLMGIDGGGIQRLPLNLPWPQPSTYSPDAQNMLMYLEQHLGQLGNEGPDGNAGLAYDVACYMSISMPVETTYPCGSKNGRVSSALAHMKQSVKDKNRNLTQITGNTSVKIARGRSAVCVQLAECLYPKDFLVHHELDGNADVQLMNAGDGVKGQMAIITVHGLMTWRHRQQGDNEHYLTLCFDRTVTMIQNPDWKITNDLVSLRNKAPAAILMCNAAHRVEEQAAKFGLPPDVMSAVVLTCTSDADLAVAANEVAAVGLEGLNQAAAVVANDVTKAISVARLAYRTGMPFEQAAAALNNVGWDLATASLGGG